MARRRASILWAGSWVCAAYAASGCASVLGLDEFEDAPPTGVGGAGAATTGTGGATSTASAGGAGGTGGGMACGPGSTTACYTGPRGTEGVGLCAAGLATCEADGSGFGPCEGEVLPATDSCATAEDEDCSGAANEGCPCAPGEVVACYGGPVGTEGVGLCVGGQQTCEADGASYGPCLGEVVPAPVDDCEALGDEDCDGYACSEPIWAQSFAGTVAFPILAGDALGNVYVLGAFTGSIAIGGFNLISAGAKDLFLAKFDHGGTPQWARQFGDAGVQSIGSVAVDSQGGVLIATGLSGAFALGGAVLTSAGGLDVAVAKFDAGGNPLWSVRFGDVSNQLPWAVAVAPGDDVVVAGALAGSMALGGANTLTSVGGDDVFLMKLNGATGAPTWGKRFGDAADQRASAVAVDTAGNTSLTGTFDGTLAFGAATVGATGTDVFVARFDGAGNNACAYAIDVGGSATAGSIAVDASGNAVVAGLFSSTAVMNAGPAVSSVGGADMFLGKSTAACTPSWLKSFGGSTTEAEARATVDTQGNIVLVGRSISSSIDFGGGALQAVGAYDMTLAKFDGSGLHKWSRLFGSPGLEIGVGVATTAGSEVIVSLADTSGIDFGTGVLSPGFPLVLLAP